MRVMTTSFLCGLTEQARPPTVAGPRLNPTAGRDPVPDEQHHDGADRGGDEPRALVRAIPSDSLADESRHESTGDAEPGRQQEAGRLVGACRQQAGDNARHEADDDDPEDAHLWS